MGMEPSPFGTSSGFSDDQDGRELDAYLAADLRANRLGAAEVRLPTLRAPHIFQRLLRKSQYWTNTSRTPFGHPVAIG
jgi:serine O-acetyltransferase